MPGIIHIIGCCGVEPCISCSSGVLWRQPNATVTVTGACDDPPCSSEVEGTYIAGGFIAFLPEPRETSCWWLWTEQVETTDLGVWYDRATSKWWAELFNIVGGGYLGEVTGNVSCDPATGKLLGAFSIPGWGVCTGCTAHVTLDA